MSSSESEDRAKEIERRPEPLCLFRCPAGSSRDEKAYVAKSEQTSPRLKPEASEKAGRKKRTKEEKLKREIWLRRRKDLSMKRRKRMSEAGKHLKTYLLTSVKPNGDQEKVYVPCLIQALETVKDAWPPNKRLSVCSYRDGSRFHQEVPCQESSTMIEETPFDEVPTPFVSRRASMPEEVMRKYFLKKDVPSDGSETNQTVPDVTSASSNDFEDRSQEKTNNGIDSPAVRKYSARGAIKRVTQNEYDRQGKGIIMQKTKEKGSQTGRSSERSDQGDTEDYRTSESLPSSSPVVLPRQSTTSGNLSSESEDVRCTCAELSSKDTSTDLFRSGNSTLSQSVSEKSTSTQDSTVSIHSVSTGGSTVSVDSNSTSPEIFGKTTAKEDTSPDEAPRVLFICQGRRHLRRFFRKRYFKFPSRRPYCRRHNRGGIPRECEYSKKKITEERGEDEEDVEDEEDEEDEELNVEDENEKNKEVDVSRRRQETEENGEENYKTVKYKSEELYMMQQMRHRKLTEKCRRFSLPLPVTPNAASVSGCRAGGTQLKELQDRILIPRYSALPRTLSMLVNTSSGDTINSDSDSLSLADSLEEFPVVHVHHLSHDTKKELKPVRGEVVAPPEAKTKTKRKISRSRAFFVSMNDPYGEDELISCITKIPEPPEKIKERINERQLRILQKNLRRREVKEKKRQRRNAKDDHTRWNLGIRSFPAGGEHDGTDKVTKRSERKSDRCGTKLAAQFNESLGRENQYNRRKKSRKEKGTGTLPRTTGQQLEKQKTTAMKEGEDGTSTFAKPQAVIHPSQMPASEENAHPKNKQTISQVRPLRFRQQFEPIPEEKSSSVSSTDEKKPSRRSSRCELLTLSEREASLRRCSLSTTPNLLFAKFTGNSRRGIPNEEKSLILVSPKNVVSHKGRDALIAMNREDFNRLSKGWMNFYMLKETSDTSEESSPDERPTKGASRPFGKAKTAMFAVAEKAEGADLTSEREAAPADALALRFHSSNTILTPLGSEKKLTLPELHHSPPVFPTSDHQSTHKNSTVVLPKVTPATAEWDGMDSDTTVYCQPPPLIVPRLAFHGSGDFPSEGSLSDSRSDSDNMEKKCVMLPMKRESHGRKRGVPPRLRLRKGHHEGGRRAEERGRSQGYPEWSVTVAGTLELTSSTPDLEMRLSFPANGCAPPQASQSDSGFAEEGSLIIEPSGKTLPNEKAVKNRRWTVTVKNPKQGETEDSGRKIEKVHVLPSIGRSQSRNVKKVLKQIWAHASGREYDENVSIDWPKIETMRSEWTEGIRSEDEELSVRGSAVSIEKKPRPPTMTEKDLTRNSTAKSGSSDSRQWKQQTNGPVLHL